jgi:YVTN family beta-propeller protein
MPPATAAGVEASASAAPFAYIANAGDTPGTVSVLDTATDAVVAIVTGVGTGPSGMAVNSLGTRAYVTDAIFSGTYVIDTAHNAVVAIIGPGERSIAVSPDGTRL